MGYFHYGSYQNIELEAQSRQEIQHGVLNVRGKEVAGPMNEVRETWLPSTKLSVRDQSFRKSRIFNFDALSSSV